MESLVIEKIKKPIRKINLPNLQSSYPDARSKGRVIVTKVRGVTFNNEYESRQEVISRMREGDLIWLETEPTNPFDKNAIAVFRYDGKQVGYLSKNLAASIVAFFKAYRFPVKGKVTLITGSRWNGYSLGVVITFKLPMPKQSNNNGHIPSFDDWDEWDN